MKPFFVVLLLLSLTVLIEAKGRTKCEYIKCGKGQVCVEQTIIQKKRCHVLNRTQRKVKHWCSYRYMSTECTSNSLCGCNDNEICRVTMMSKRKHLTKLRNISLKGHALTVRDITCRKIQHKLKLETAN